MLNVKPHESDDTVGGSRRLPFFLHLHPEKGCLHSGGDSVTMMPEVGDLWLGPGEGRIDCVGSAVEEYLLILQQDPHLIGKGWRCRPGWMILSAMTWP